jgi:hypothetical protein
MRVDLSGYYNQRDTSGRAEFLDRVIEQSDENEDPIFITDLLVEFTKAEPLLKRLRMDEKNIKKYKLRVISDEWGNKLYRGEVVTRRHKSNVKVKNEGKLTPGHEQSRMKVLKTYDKWRYKCEKFVIDDRGCIEVSIDDAEYFLPLFGIVQDGVPVDPTSRPIGGNSVEPVDAPNGQKLHVHYYQLQEVEKKDYEKLPKVGKRPDGELRRGIDKPQ